VEEYFKNNISEVVLDGASGQPIDGMTSSQVEAKEFAERAKLPLYVWKENGEVQKYAFPVSGKGLWSTIYGYMALEKDLATIKGVTFYRMAKPRAWAVNAKRPGSRTTSRASR
jgi:Na+-transporting NADH:ubiquinone oxidoreductase subunit NqrC